MTGSFQNNTEIHERSMLLWMIAATCVIECLLWVGSFSVMYWFVPGSVEKFRALNIELPTSMNNVIRWMGFAIQSWWLSIPVLLAFIVVPKVYLSRQRYSGSVLFLLVVVSVCVPVVVCIWGTGIPKLFDLGLIP